jgi:hypothetical protein
MHFTAEARRHRGLIVVYTTNVRLAVGAALAANYLYIAMNSWLKPLLQQTITSAVITVFITAELNMALFY